MSRLDLVLDAARGVKGDLYLPQEAGLHPLVIAVHGGGWRRGSPRALAQWGELFRRNGVAMLAISYRLTENGKTWPDNLVDVTKALEWAMAHAKHHQLDPDRVIMLGASAGGHLAALAALTRNEAKTPPVRGFVGVYGVYDLVSHWEADLIKNAPASEDPSVRMLGASPLDDPGLYFQASPINHVTFAARGLNVQLIYGDHDHDIDFSQSLRFARRLRQAGARVECVPVVGAGHLWFSMEDLHEPTSHCAFVAPRLLAFVKRVFA